MLSPDTKYHYHVIAVSIYNLSSVPSEIIFLQTRPEEKVHYRDWISNTCYSIGAKVHGLGRNGQCINCHISLCVSGQPGKFWKEI